MSRRDGGAAHGADQPAPAWHAAGADAPGGPSPLAPVFIKQVQDGRRVEVIGPWLCLDGTPETSTLLPVAAHPRHEAIRREVPEATHLAGRIVLTAAEAARAAAALAAGHAAALAEPAVIERRLRRTTNEALRLRLEDD